MEPGDQVIQMINS